MWIFGRKGRSGFSACTTAEEVTCGIDGTGLTAIVTGASSGIGVETTRVLALRGVHVVMAVRNMNAGKNVKEGIVKEIPSAKIEVMELDISSITSVRKFASTFISSGLPLSLLINNAGVLVTPFMLSQDNIEMQFATNHLGHFLLTNLLLETMKKTAHESNMEGRIVNVSSSGHQLVVHEGICFDKINDESGYNSMFAYGKSKLCNILHANELARCLKEGVDITANSLHSGVIVTNILRHHSFINEHVQQDFCDYDHLLYESTNHFLFCPGYPQLFTSAQAAATTCYVALHPHVKGKNMGKEMKRKCREEYWLPIGNLTPKPLDSTPHPEPLKGPSGFSSCSTAEEVTQGIDGTGLTAIVTGASSGIGIETTRVLALRCLHVIMAVRNMDAGKNVKEAIIKEIPTAKIEVMELDLSSMESVRKFASEYNSSGLPLNLLINNAGVMGTPFMLSQDNIELQFATNHIGHFLLTNLLLETMKNTARESSIEGRIVNLASDGHRFSYREGIRFDKINDESGYSGIYAYAQSKLGNVLHANELARRLKEEGVNITANSLHPGAITTDIFRHTSIIKGVVNMIGKFVF
ncbi:hypothetical protein L1049_003514 [Liquidambar formosana]|uniref:Short-chain dehydrogenase TIC 32, chloroplastic n=1 Tax=Liquidambar formosana TaxID=63359 RepID=A0AAP0R1G8_LIQFO